MLRWYAAAARDLPWRRPDATPWGVLVSEVMLQQTPVARVLPAYGAWLARWPTPAALASDPPGEAVRQWGRLGYPRRALRLAEVARILVARHDGQVPTTYDELAALPGIGSYTAAAVASFAYGQPHAVLDTNVRRVLARVLDGKPLPPAGVTVPERRRAQALLPDAQRAPQWAVAVMELGALVCTARDPRCERCPLESACAWRRAGHPRAGGPNRPRQAYTGTDRQARGALLAVLRDATGPVPAALLTPAWPDPAQRERALRTLVADGLAVRQPDGTYALPR